MILIVSSQSDTVSSLEKSTIKVLDEAGMKHRLVQVPGITEIPLTVQHFYDADMEAYKAVIALGWVTDDIVSKSVIDGLNHLALDLGIPVIQGVRAKHERETEYAQTALKMIEILKTAV